MTVATKSKSSKKTAKKEWKRFVVHGPDYMAISIHHRDGYLTLHRSNDGASKPIYTIGNARQRFALESIVGGPMTDNTPDMDDISSIGYDDAMDYLNKSGWIHL